MSATQWIIWIGGLAFCYFFGTIWLRDQSKEFRARYSLVVCPTAELERRQSLSTFVLMLFPFGYYMFNATDPAALFLIALLSIFVFERLASLWEQSLELRDAAVQKCLKVALAAVGLTFTCFYLLAPNGGVAGDIAMALSLGVYLAFELTVPDWSRMADRRRLFRQ